MKRYCPPQSVSTIARKSRSLSSARHVCRPYRPMVRSCAQTASFSYVNVGCTRACGVITFARGNGVLCALWTLPLHSVSRTASERDCKSVVMPSRVLRLLHGSGPTIRSRRGAGHRSGGCISPLPGEQVARSMTVSRHRSSRSATCNCVARHLDRLQPQKARDAGHEARAATTAQN
jgi:hypothetical protein